MTIPIEIGKQKKCKGCDNEYICEPIAFDLSFLTLKFSCHYTLPNRRSKEWEEYVNKRWQ